MATTRGWRRIVAGVVAVATLAPGGTGDPAAGLDPAPGDGPWVSAAYHDLLDRYPTPGQSQHRQDQLAAGTSRRAIADQLVASRERALLIVADLYDRVLDRPSDPWAETYWSNRLMAGTAESTFASFVYGSPELYARAGGTPEGYVTLLYRDVLGREPDAAGLAYWTARVGSGENRTGLARSWYLTPEATGLRAGLVFLRLLDRPPTPAERVDWAGRLRRFDLRRIEAALVSTPEYVRGSTDPGRPTRLTAGNGTSTEPSISADGRIVAFSSTANDLTPAGSPPGADIFVLDRETGRVRAITAGDGASIAPDVSADGTTVVFQSAATNLVAADDNGQVDVFRAPAAGGPIERLTDGDGPSTVPSTSGDGTVVAFLSTATDLVEVDPNGARADVYVRADGDPAGLGRIGGVGDVATAQVSADGGTLVFEAEDLEQGTAPRAYLAPLPLGPAPEPVALSEIFGRGPTVSADGSRAIYVEYEPIGGSYQSSVILATVDEGVVVARRRVPGGYKPGWARLADGGGHVLVSAAQLAGGAPTLLFALDGESPLTRALPDGRPDVIADGRTVVGVQGTQLVLFQAD